MHEQRVSFRGFWSKAVLTLFGTLAWTGYLRAESHLDNSLLIPRIFPDSQVRMEGLSPDWVKTLIMVEFRVETATSEGTFAALGKVLDHYAEMGVNGLWINPIQRRGSKGNGYCNWGIHTIEPLLTGTDDAEASLQVVKQFVEQAHRRNIRVIFDVVVWGTSKQSPLISEHPEFYCKVDGKFREVWGGYAFDWENPKFRKWFKKNAVRFIERTDADGCRVDLAPDTSGYFFKEIREALVAKGRKILVVSEIPNTRGSTFDFEQTGVHGWTEEPNYSSAETLEAQKRKFDNHAEYLFRSNIVDAIRSGSGIGKASLQQQGCGGQFRFYTSNLLDHDDTEPFVRGSRVRFAYASILAPFIPVWWIGEEWNNPKKLLPGQGGGGVMYFNTIDWSQREIPSNRAFFEDIKIFIRIRRSYPDIFEQFPKSLRNANITSLDTRRNGKPNTLPAYVRTGKGRAILVVPNYRDTGAAHMEIIPDLAAMGLEDGWKYRITDLLTGNIVAEEKLRTGNSFFVDIKDADLGVYLIERE